jgi:hypothetical protein
MRAFTWMSQFTDQNKDKYFFETRVTEYRHGGSRAWSQGSFGTDRFKGEKEIWPS